VQETLGRMTRRAVAMAVTGALALSLFAASAVSADDGSYVDEAFLDDGDSGFTLDLDFLVDLSGDYLGIRWY
jgi:hypothetical protein